MTSTQSFIGKKKWELDTPCLVIDEKKFLHNMTEMQDFVRKHKKQLRPHTKTHKCSTIAKKQIENGAIGICTTKVAEAEVMIANGVRGVLVTSPQVTPTKISRLMKLVQKDPNVMVVVDSKENGVALNHAAKEANVRLKVLVEIDGGQERTGISESGALQLSKELHALGNLELKGVQCYLGHLQHVETFEERKKVILEGMSRGVRVIHQLKEAGLPSDILTGGGTGSFEIDVDIPEMTDIQPGSYVCMDMEYKLIASQNSAKEFSPTFSDAPMTLLSTVVSSHQPLRVTIDAGLKALYKDGPGPKVMTPKVPTEYTWAGDEHGILHFKKNEDKLPTGSVVELVVSHCDPTINLFDKFWVVRDDIVVDMWPIDCRGCVE